MKRSLLVGWHKWLAIPFAIALLAWTGSGIVMVMPRFTPDAVAPYSAPDVAWDQMNVSPAEAVVTVSEAVSVPVSDVSILMVGESPMYRVRFRGGSRLVDPNSGALVEIDADRAVEVARARALPEVETEAVEYVESHNWLYPSGPLPAYRVRFATGDNSWAYVGVDTGEVFFSSTLLRLRTAIVSVHEFRTLNPFLTWFPSRPLMFICSLGLLGIIFTGYYLVFWKNLHGGPRKPGAETA